MKKLYYKIELRMGEWILERNKDIDLEEEIGELFYYSDGYLIIDDEVIIGFLSNDLITGNLTEDEIFIEILEYEETSLLYSSFSSEIDYIEFPGKYLLSRQDIEEDPEYKNHFAIINFIEKIQDVSNQKKIEETLKEVKKIYFIP